MQIDMKQTYEQNETYFGDCVKEPVAMYAIDANALKVKGVEMLMSINDAKTLQIVVDEIGQLCKSSKGLTRRHREMRVGLTDEQLSKELTNYSSLDMNDYEPLSQEDMRFLSRVHRPVTKGISRWLD